MLLNHRTEIVGRALVVPVRERSYGQLYDQIRRNDSTTNLTLSRRLFRMTDRSGDFPALRATVRPLTRSDQRMTDTLWPTHNQRTISYDHTFPVTDRTTTYLTDCGIKPFNL